MEKKVTILKNDYQFNWWLKARFWIIRNIFPCLRDINTTDLSKWEETFSLPLSEWDVGGSGGGLFSNGNDKTHYTGMVDGKFIAKYDPKTITHWDGLEYFRPIAVTKLNTQKIFRQQYGRFVFTMTLPKGPGTHSAAWMWGMKEPTEQAPYKVYGEIDLLEVFARSNSNWSGIGRINVHGRLPGDPELQWKLKSAKIRIDKEKNLGKRFYEIALEWEPDEIRVYYDGICVFKFRNYWFLDTFFNIPDMKMWLVLNNNIRQGLINEEDVPKVDNYFKAKNVQVYK